MKINFKKAILGVMVLAGVSGLASCGETQTKAPTLQSAFISPSQATYTNMRPAYNFYWITISSENLEIYDDSSYKLTMSFSTYSAVILPEEGDEFQGNERYNYFIRYEGTYTSQADDLEPTTVYYTLGVPTRLVGSNDKMGFYDTANWTATMAEKTAEVQLEYDTTTGASSITGTTTYTTGAEYLTAHAFKDALKVNTYSTDYSMDFATITPAVPFFAS